MIFRIIMISIFCHFFLCRIGCWLVINFAVRKSTPLHELPYLPVYNAHPCIIRTPILDCTLEKKKEAENRGSGYERTA